MACRWLRNAAVLVSCLSLGACLRAQVLQGSSVIVIPATNPTTGAPSAPGSLLYQDTENPAKAEGFSAPPTIMQMTPCIWQLPATDAAGALTSDGSCHLSFSGAGAGYWSLSGSNLSPVGAYNVMPNSNNTGTIGSDTDYWSQGWFSDLGVVYEVFSNLIPNGSITVTSYTLGSTGRYWNSTYTEQLLVGTAAGGGGLLQELDPYADNNLPLGSSSYRYSALYVVNGYINQLNVVTNVNTNLIPSANNTFTLGSSSYGWANLYTVGLSSVGGSNISVGANLVPTVAGTINLGSASYPWGTLYVTSCSGCGGYWTLSGSNLSPTAAYNVLPYSDSLYALGSPSVYWNDVYSNSVEALSIVPKSGAASLGSVSTYWPAAYISNLTVSSATISSLSVTSCTGCWGTWATYGPVVNSNLSSTTTTNAVYQETGKTVAVNLTFSGTSNGSNPTILLPTTAAISALSLACTIEDATASTFELCNTYTNSGSNVVTLYAGASGAWTNSHSYQINIDAVYESQ